MKKHILDLDYIINVNNFRNIQDSIAEATDMAMLTVDYKGKPITHHSKCTELCKAVRAHPQYTQICEKCDSRGGIEATRLNQPYIYLCHMGIVDFAIPITVDGQYLGAVMGGQVLVEDEQDKECLEKITSQNTNVLDIISECDLNSLYSKLPVMKLDKIKAIATMMYNISNYIVEEAVLKINLVDETSKVDNPDLKLLDEISNDDDSVGICQKFNYNENKKLINHDHIILRPALEYIEKNYMRNIGLDSMASLCNISSSYFSKLFNKVAEDNFANYINKIRINKAKEILEKGDVPITNIALDLGFEDSGYFIKVFKKMEGMTPSAYRSTKAIFE
ncbi:MAG TPA: PocR ligand-binding domain-containing protein [Ruminiclostridium sp.]